MVKKDSDLYRLFLTLVLKAMLFDFLPGPFLWPLCVQIDFFPPSRKARGPGGLDYGPVEKAGKKARVLFFISPGCRSCPDEAVKLQKEFKRLGVDYEIEGVFVGGPPQVGAYLAELRSYPFSFELGVDMDGSLARQYGVTTFPSAVVEIAGKKTIVTRADELEGRLK